MAKTERKKLIDKLDDLTREIVRKRDVVCQHCGKTSSEAQLQISHTVTRGWFGARWDLLNVMLLCAGCHQLWHKDPAFMVEWMKEKFPGRIKYLASVKKCRAWKNWELKELIEERKQNLSEIDS